MHTAGIFKATELPLEHLPTVTVGMLIDFLSDHDVMVRPSASRRIVRWFDAGSQHGIPLPAGLRSGQVLHVCRMREAQAMLESNGSAFVCALCPGDTAPAWTADHAERLIVVRQKDTFSYFLFLVQRFFTDVMMWEGELDRIVLRKGSLHELLNVGNSGLGDFMLCLDASCNVLAYTEGIAPPDNVFCDAVASGCQLPEDAPAAKGGPEDRAPTSLRAPARKAGVQLLTATPAHPHPQLRCEVFVEGTRFATLILASTSDSISSGTRDLFAALASRAESICEVLWSDQVRIESPYHFFFTRLIEGDIPDKLSLEAHLKTTAIPCPAQLKLVLLDLERMPEAPLPTVAAAARRFNRGDCYCFTHKGNLCALCYAAEGDSQLSHEKTRADLVQLLYEPHGVVGSASQIFESISDLDLAYRQAAIAKNLREIIEREGRSGPGEFALIPFENCLIYYLVGMPDKDERFLSFAFSHTLMQKISAEDEAHGTDYLEIFWQYLSCERNATTVAERLHLHRNTVLYRIDKIQKRFDLDLSSQEVREKMLVDFKVFFLMQNRSSIKRLFEDVR